MPASACPSRPFRPSLVACAVFAAMVAAAAPPAGAQPDRIRPVTDAELEDPSPDEWLMWRRTLNGWGFRREHGINYLHTTCYGHEWHPFPSACPSF